MQYFSPDGKIGFWKRDEFNYPLLDYDTPDGADETHSTSSFHTSSALADTAFFRSLGLSEYINVIIALFYC